MILTGPGQSARIENCPNTDCEAENIYAGGPYTDHHVTVGLDEPTNVEPDIICPECNAIITVNYQGGRVRVGQRGFRGLGITQPHSRIYGATAEQPRPGVIEHHPSESNDDVDEVHIDETTPQERSMVQQLLYEHNFDHLSPMEDYQDAKNIVMFLREDADEQPLNVTHDELKAYIRERAEDAQR